MMTARRRIGWKARQWKVGEDGQVEKAVLASANHRLGVPHVCLEKNNQFAVIKLC
jgi:hypothetical protein